MSMRYNFKKWGYYSDIYRKIMQFKKTYTLLNNVLNRITYEEYKIGFDFLQKAEEVLNKIPFDLHFGNYKKWDVDRGLRIMRKCIEVLDFKGIMVLDANFNQKMEKYLKF